MNTYTNMKKRIERELKRIEGEQDYKNKSRTAYLKMILKRVEESLSNGYN